MFCKTFIVSFLNDAFRQKKITEFRQEFNITKSKHQGDAKARKEFIDALFALAAAKKSVGM